VNVASVPETLRVEHHTVPEGMDVGDQEVSRWLSDAYTITGAPDNNSAPPGVEHRHFPVALVELGDLPPFGVMHEDRQLITEFSLGVLLQVSRAMGQTRQE
jgi:hypothetical protein